MAGRYQNKRGAYADMDLATLYQGELYYCTDTKQTFMAHGDGTGAEIPSSATISAIASLVYPVGCIYQSVVSTSPATLFGGTWAALGAGRVLVGIDATDAAMDTVEETGGAKTHTLISAEMPNHNHQQYVSANFGSGGPGQYVDMNSEGTGASAYPQNVVTGSAGSGAAHNNLPPFLVVYRWKRTA